MQQEPEKLRKRLETGENFSSKHESVAEILIELFVEAAYEDADERV